MDNREPNLSIECPEIGMRAWFLNEARGLERTLGFSTSNFVTMPWGVFEEIQGNVSERLGTAKAANMVDDAQLGDRTVHPDIVAHYSEIIRPVLSRIVSLTGELDGDIIISRPSPLDEHTRPDLSFAGVYKSHMPYAHGLAREEALRIGTANVLAGRFTKYGNSYYDRHSIATDRRAGVMYMQPFFDVATGTPLVHGTAYVAGELIRNEYLIRPLSDRPQRDPRLMARWGGDVQLYGPDQTIERDLDFANRMATVLDGLHRQFNAPLDIEYLMDDDGSLYVVQIRQISARHMANWILSSRITDSFTSQDSAIVNSVAAAEGRVVDLRDNPSPIDLDAMVDSILVISHEDKGHGMHTQRLLDTIRNQKPQGELKVVVEHAGERIRDHLQYALAEDPRISFIVQTNDSKVIGELRNGTDVRIESNGLTSTIARL